MVAQSVPAAPTRLANIETEAALLGAMMIDPRVIDPAADRLRVEDFAEPVHGRIFDAVVREHALGNRPTPITLRPLLDGDPGIQALGGLGYLAQLTGSGAALIGYRHFIDQILDLATRRRLADALVAARDDAENFDLTIAELVDRADAALVSSIERREASRSFSLDDSISLAIQRVETIQEGDGKVGAPTGIAEMDELIGGFEPGQLVIVAGRPGMGKTAVACSAALGLASAGHGVLFVSLEMQAEELGMRMVCDLACQRRGDWVPFDRIVNATLSPSEHDRLAAARRSAAGWPLRIEDAGSMSLARLTLAVRRAKRRMAAKGQTLKVVIVDYLQLVQPDRRAAGPYEAVSEVSRGLKALAKDLGVAVVALAQLSRAVEQREDKRPQLSDLRDSGQIEQDADAVVFLYREEYYLERAKPKRGQEEDHTSSLDQARGWLTLICAKRRNGRTGSANCLYLSTYQAVRSADWRST